eukprot:4237954-Amphidinium_carterae.1
MDVGNAETSSVIAHVAFRIPATRMIRGSEAGCQAQCVSQLQNATVAPAEDFALESRARFERR